MSDTEEPEQRPALPPEGVSLGRLSAGGFDSSLKAGADAAPEGEWREDAGEAPPVAEIPADEDRLGLPRGGLAAFRKSGGMRFSSRGFVVFRSGWVVPLTGTSGRPRRITDEAIEALEALILRGGLSRTRRRKAKGSPDGYSYEITARYGGRTRHAEAADGAIPEELGRLIEVLQRLMPGG
ncbi:MAG: hypothetical protein HGA45_00565 [Chloroflexales bacterium]|nr:hypothetical protein [Chloroflexales bacterium]